MITLQKINSSLNEYINSPEMKQLVATVMESQNTFLLDLLQNALVIVTTFEHYEKKWTKVERLKRTRRDREEEIDGFLTSLHHVLELSRDSSIFPNGKPYSEHDAFNYIRGAILEALVIEIVGHGRFEEEYEGNWQDDCEVYDHMSQIIFYTYYKEPGIIRSLGKKQNIDIAGWKDQCGGEFYECKLSPSGFKPENMSYLEQIYSVVRSGDRKLLQSVSLGGITLDTSEKLKREVSAFSNSWFVAVGRDRLFDLGNARLIG